jgi:hypothetical protein
MEQSVTSAKKHRQIKRPERIQPTLCRKRAFMLMRSNRTKISYFCRVLLLALVLSGCSVKKQRLAYLCNKLFEQEHSNIAAFVNPRPEDRLTMSSTKIDGSLYCVVFTPNKDKAIAFDVPPETTINLVAVRNYGYGQLEKGGDWNLWHTNAKGDIFESQGGIGTLAEIAEAIRITRNMPSITDFVWQ